MLIDPMIIHRIHHLPSNSSSSASSHTGRLFGKRKGPFPKQHEMEGKIQQKTKKPTTDPQIDLKHSGKGRGYMMKGAQSGNTRGSSSNRGKGNMKKDLGAIPKTQRTQFDDFLDKNKVPPTSSPPPQTQLGMEPPATKLFQKED